MGVKSEAAGSRAACAAFVLSAVVGGGCWLLTPPAGWALGCAPEWPEWLAVVILLFSPLVLVPLALRLVARRCPLGGDSRAWTLAGRAQLPAALLLSAAFALPAGPVAAALTVPWVLFTLVVAVIGLRRLWEGGVRPLSAACENAGLIFLAVGGAWTLTSRLGARPLDFDAMIVLLTAAHFHFAGFILPLLTSWTAQELNDRLTGLACPGVMGGVPLVAAGITANQLGLPCVEALAAWFLSAACMLLAVSQGRLGWQTRVSPAGSLLVLSSIALVAGMILAAAYGIRSHVSLAWLDIPTMLVTHATVNAFGFCLAGLAGWAWRWHFGRV